MFSSVVLLTPLFGRHVENWWMRQSCRCKKVSPHNSHLNPGPTVFTASSNLNTFFTFFSGFSFSFNSLSEIDSMSFTSGFEARILLNLGLHTCMELVEEGEGHLGFDMTCLSSGPPSLRPWSPSIGSVPCLFHVYVFSLCVCPVRPLFLKTLHNSGI